MDADVLIVGAGPTGLMLANQLVRRGVRVLIIDRHAGPALQTRALGVQARTMEIYAQLGIISRALELGKRGTGANLWAQGRRMAHVPLGDAGKSVSPYPFILILGQDDNERIMGEKLGELGVSVQWNTELVDFTQHTDGVVATLKKPEGGRRTVTAAFIAGCDGARSAVRETIRHNLPRRALRARVLRRRCRDDGHDGPGRSQRLSLARRLPPSVPDARRRPLADRRHRASRPCAPPRTYGWNPCCPPCASEAGADCRSSRAAGFPPTASITEAHRASAMAEPSCLAMPRTSTAPSARKA